jgi:DNA invertase Pin-like site-specific DNA recombinase
MIGLDKIRPEHRDRSAFVYARQSTAMQVIHHRTSTDRQLGLAELATKLGWEKPRVVVVDDLGRSGKFSEGREGFQHLAAEMSLARVGAVLSLDASRLARSSADWHRLLEVAALTRTLLIDEETVYDPRDPNDRLVLGMKGTMADFELVWLRQRMEGGRWYRARRGEYRRPIPAGYVYEDDESARLVVDPDEEIRRAVSLVFERFRGAGTLQDVVGYFIANGIRFPARLPGGAIEWGRVTRHRARQILTNPVYAGAYVFGREKSETILEAGERRLCKRRLPRSEWPVTIRDAHPGYITWEEYLANEKRMAENSARRGAGNARGAVREGRALLQGLLLCARCGARVMVLYAGTAGRYPRYHCRNLEHEQLGDRCLLLQAPNLDEPVVDLVLGMLTRERLLDATRVIEIIDEQNVAVDRQWQLRLERARYDARRAEKQFDACEPDNRVVGRTLEKRWNERLTELETLEQQYNDFKHAQRIEISEVERQRIQSLAADLPRLWRAKTTEDRDRKLLLRVLIKDVSVRAVDVPRACLRVKVLWHTHAVTELEVERIGHSKARPIPYRVLSTTAPVAPAAQIAR